MVFSLLLVPGGNATELLQPVDCPLHQVAHPVQGAVEGAVAPFITFPGDGVTDSPPPEISANLAAAITFIAADSLGSGPGTAPPCSFHRSTSHQLLEHAGLVPLSRGQHEGYRLARPLDPQVDLGAKTAPGAA